MPETLVSPQLLDDLIEGRLLSGPRLGEAAMLARLAADCRQLRVHGPDALATVRMRRRYAAYLSGERPGIARWLFAWLGAGPTARPLRERLAAGVMIVAAAGGSASYASGVSPREAAADLGQLAVSVIVNLDPHNGAGGELSMDTATPTPTGTPAAGTTPTPAGASTAQAAPPPPGASAAAGPPGSPGGATGPAQQTPTASPASPSATATQNATPAPTRTPTSAATAAPPASAPSSPGEPVTASPTATPTPPPTWTPKPSTPTPGTSPTPTATSTPTPTSTPTAAPTPTPEDDEEEEDD